MRVKGDAGVFLTTTLAPGGGGGFLGNPPGAVIEDAMISLTPLAVSEYCGVTIWQGRHRIHDFSLHALSRERRLRRRHRGRQRGRQRGRHRIQRCHQKRCHHDHSRTLALLPVVASHHLSEWKGTRNVGHLSPLAERWHALVQKTYASSVYGAEPCKKSGQGPQDRSPVP